MGQFQIRGQTFAVSREEFAPVIPRLTDRQIALSLEDLVALEQAKKKGWLTCSTEVWAELVLMAKDLAFEARWRPFARSCGIYLEVR